MNETMEMRGAEVVAPYEGPSGTPAPTERTPAVIGAEIRQIQKQFRVMTVLYAVEAGRRLCEAKAMLEHGEWGNWVKNETGMSQSSASRLMKIFREYSDDQITLEGAVAKSSTLQNLTVSNALRLLAIPEEEREAFALEHDAEHLSARELEKVIAERDAMSRDLAETEKEVDKLEDELKAAREKVKELESRPVPVAVETDEEAVQKAAADAKAEAQKEIDRLQKKLAAAEKNREKAEQAAKDAEKHAANAKELIEQAARNANAVKAEAREEVERLKMQLAQSDTTTVQFKVIFENVQEGMNDLMRLIRQAPEDTAGKLRKAAGMLLEQFGKQVQG